ncbi:MAG: polysaccharide deacetylase family protein [Acidimicrobiales bacterium]
MPGTVAARVHSGGSVTRVDDGGRCEIIGSVRSDAGPSVVVRQHQGRSWHRAVPGEHGLGGYELRLGDAVLSSPDATFTAIRRPGGGWVVVVLDGGVLARGPTDGREIASTEIEVSAPRGFQVSAEGEIGRPRTLVPGDIEGQPWVRANRVRDRAVVWPDPSPGAGFEVAPGGEPAELEPARPLPGRRGLARREPTRREPGRRQPTTGYQRAAVHALARAVCRTATATGQRAQRRVRPRLAVTVLVVGAGLLGALPDQASTMTVVVDGRPVRMLRSQPTVASAVLAAHLQSEDGALLAVVSGKVLDAHFAPAGVLVDQAPASSLTKIEDGARVEVMPVSDAFEPTDRHEVPVPPPALPDVEFYLTYPGAGGTEDQVYGTVSGEVVSHTPVVEVRPPRPELGNVVALTFDDGPHPVWTPQILDILRSEGVKATFCVVGSVGAKRPDLVVAERDAGNAMCDHTENHVIGLDRADPDKVVEEIDGGAQLLQSLLGAPPSFYRPPGGSLGPLVIDVAHRGGMRVLHWSVDSRDYTKPPADALVAKVVGAARPGSVILLHDGGGDRSQTVAALRPIIQQLKAKGFSFTTPLAPPGG